MRCPIANYCTYRDPPSGSLICAPSLIHLSINSLDGSCQIVQYAKVPLWLDDNSYAVGHGAWPVMARMATSRYAERCCQFPSLRVQHHAVGMKLFKYSNGMKDPLLYCG